MIAIIDYGVGNLFSLKSSFLALGEQTVITNDKKTIENAEKIVLPGVGAFADAAMKLRNKGLDELIKKEVYNGKMLLGICLGMQLLFEKSYEFGEHKGLGLIGGDVVPIKEIITENLKIPHIGWNSLHFVKDSPIFKYVKENDYVYFVHSYAAVKCEKALIAQTDYSQKITAAVANKNVFGCQFHPEKSGNAGMSILKAFCETEEKDLC